MNKVKRYIIFFIAALGIGLYFGTLALLRSDMDFIVLYIADVSLLHGINPYDVLAVKEMLASLRGGLSANFYLPPLVYPPWYFLATFYLGWLSPALAARAWYVLNTAMLGGAVYLLTEGRPLRQRFLAGCASFLFMPVYGLLYVGQYTAPLLLGTALFLRAVRRESYWEAILGLLLLTFKPHFGGWLFLAGVGWLVFQRAKWRYFPRVLSGTLIGGLILAGASLLLIPTWPQDYWQALRGFGAMDTFLACDLCAGLPLLLAKWVSGQASMTLGLAIGFSLLLLAVCGVMLWRRPILQDVGSLLTLTILLSLLLMPYGMDYDYSLLVLPFLWLVGRLRRRTDWFVLGLAYFAPWLALLLADRQAMNISLLIGSGLLLSMLLFSPRQMESAA